MLAIVLSRSACAVVITRSRASGEVVLEERPALPDDVPVLASGWRGRAGNERRWADGDVDQQDERPHDQHQTTMPMSSGACAASAAVRSAASISDTSRPMKSGITVSSSAPPGSPRTCRTSFGLPYEIPVEGEQTRRGAPARDARCPGIRPWKIFRRPSLRRGSAPAVSYRRS